MEQQITVEQAQQILQAEAQRQQEQLSQVGEQIDAILKENKMEIVGLLDKNSILQIVSSYVDLLQQSEGKQTVLKISPIIRFQDVEAEATEE